MAALRRELDADVLNVGESARAMADWRFYVERYPFAIAAAAVAAGFLLVPKKPQVLVPDADTLAELARSNRVWVKTGAPKPSVSGRSMLGGLLALAATAATKAAVNWGSQQFQASMAARKRADRPDEAEEDQDEDEEILTRGKHYPPR
jgi:hypothetical protein